MKQEEHNFQPMPNMLNNLTDNGGPLVLCYVCLVLSCSQQPFVRASAACSSDYVAVLRHRGCSQLEKLFT